jgi:hypothetical protein
MLFLKKFLGTMDAVFLYKGRLFFGAYISVLVHSVFLFYFFNSVGMDWENKIMVCGPDWIYPKEEQEEETELSLEMEFADKLGQGEGEAGTGEEGESSGEEGFAMNPDFDKEKYGDGAWKDLVERLEESSELRKNFKNNFDGIVKDGNVSDSYISRNRDYEDITVKEVFPTIYTIDKPFQYDIQEAPEELTLHQERNKIIDMYRNLTDEDDILQIELESEGEKRSKSALAMSKEDRMKYLDKKLPLKKEEQMKDFTSRFMNYDPDKGDLPLFLRDLYYENLQRLAYSFSSDPTYFTIDYFQENLNKEDFLRNSLALYSEFKDHKLGVEILFTLENIYEIQARAIGLYFQNLAIFPSLSPESRKTLRVEVIRRVLERYKPIFNEKNIKTLDDVNSLYTKKRLDIMDTLIANTPDGYRRADAIFEKGRIHWEYSLTLGKEGRDQEQSRAIKIWSGIQEEDKRNGDFLNQKPLEDIQDILAMSNRNVQGILDFNSQNRISSVLRNRINDVLSQKKIREDRLLWKKSKEDIPTSEPPRK